MSGSIPRAATTASTPIASIFTRTGAGSAATSRCSIPAGPSRGAKPLLPPTAGVRLRLLGLIDLGKPKRACRRRREWRRPRMRTVHRRPRLEVRRLSIGASVGSDDINPSTTASWSPADAAGRPASQINGAPTNTGADSGDQPRGRFETSHPMYGAKRWSVWSPPRSAPASQGDRARHTDCGHCHQQTQPQRKRTGRTAIAGGRRTVTRADRKWSGLQLMNGPSTVPMA